MSLGISRAAQSIFVFLVVSLLIIACGTSESSEFAGFNEPTTSPNEPAPNGSFNNGGGSGANSCNKRTCADQGIECGPAGDGCGGIIPDCGKCGAGQRCGGPNAPSKCVNPTTATGCVPKTCAELGVSCGAAGDGCGGVLQCGSCKAGEQCGANGKPSQCVPISVLGPNGGACVPKTCADYPQGTCGQQSDGCGSTITCLVCKQPEFCGGAGPSKCGTTSGGTCTKKTCADYAPGTCGPQSDGCGGTTADCMPGGCPAPQVCGGAGTPSVCGGGGVVGPGGGPCIAKTCAQLGKNCGKNADGCGNIIDCGSSCPAGQVCGGAGTPNVCGVPPCTPKSSCDPGMNCGSQADGCGGTVTCGVGAGACPGPGICGGGGQPNVCGGGTIGGPGGCTPATCASLGKNCGPVADGCGNLLQCGTCNVAGEYCGGSGTASVCGTPACTPTTCQALGMNCGYAANGCGGLLDCGGPNNCPVGQYCGGGGANKCGSGTPAPGCVNYCLDQAICAAGSQTKVTGTVLAPNGTLPLPGALIYVPNASKTYPHGITTFTDGVASGSCQQCSTQASGNPLISATSNADGTFTLNNVPANTSFPLVIQMGKWRRVVSIPAIAPCTSQALTAEQTRMPKFQNEGNDRTNIPLVAISTGQVDALECVFRKLGINDNQFTNPTGTGRIRLYQDENDLLNTNANGGARIDANTPRTQNALVNAQANLDKYDAVVFGCPGDENTRDATQRDRVRAYANKGGRVFATHFSYVWLNTTTDFSTAVTWDTANARSSGNGAAATWPAEIDTSPGKRLLFSQWLGVPSVNALSATSPPRITITEARNNADIPVASTSQSWITKYDDPAGNGKAVLHFTFNTPVGAAAANQCGRVLFSDFHVTVGGVLDTTNFPAECTTTTLTSQEKVLAFMLFDLTSCIDPINPPPPPTCSPLTCQQQGLGCGLAGNGCGQTIDCGPCPPGQTCGGGGVPSQCGGACTVRTCQQANANCGTIPDGCGSTQNCGTCPPGQTCGGGGVANQCGAPSCTGKTCQQLGLSCGLTGDGCGATVNCGACPLGQTCGGGGVPGQCGAPSCTPIGTCPAGKNCGQMPDGCGGVVDCGKCVPGQTCGGGGLPNVCGAASCAAKTCQQLGAQCGGISDGCGSVADCGVCPAGQICQSNICLVPQCSPTTCSAQGVQCGPLGDGCGGLLQCGTCPPGQVCGGGGQPGICGTNPCQGKTCADLGAVCGKVANGCGALTPDCGDCKGNTTCQNGACINACTPKTCKEIGAQCGPVADGCGSTVDCGPCPPGLTCGANNKPNQCGDDGIK